MTSITRQGLQNKTLILSLNVSLSLVLSFSLLLSLFLQLTGFSGYIGVFGVVGVLGVCGCSWSTTHFSDLFLRFANISAPANCLLAVLCTQIYHMERSRFSHYNHIYV